MIVTKTGPRPAYIHYHIGMYFQNMSYYEILKEKGDFFHYGYFFSYTLSPPYQVLRFPTENLVSFLNHFIVGSRSVDL